MPRCKCCNAESRFLGNVDFAKSCHDRFEKVFVDSGILIPYFGCKNCSFVFTNYMDNWSIEDFKNKIYNQDYCLADGILPGFETGLEDQRKTVSYENGKHIATLFEASAKAIRVLDYGSGGDPGDTGLALLDKGFDLTSFDPYRSNDMSKISNSQFDLIIAIEVFEHCHDLNSLGLQMNQLLSENGLIVFSTLLHPHPTPDNVLSSWYIAPRNGHISIFSLNALTILFRRYKINIVQSAFGLFGFKNLPLYKNEIFI